MCLSTVAAAFHGAFMPQPMPGRLVPPPLGPARAAEERMRAGAEDPPATAAHSLIVVALPPVTEGPLLVMEEPTLDAAGRDMQEEPTRVVAEEPRQATAGLLLAIAQHTVGGEERQLVTAPLPAMEGQPWVAVQEPPAVAGRPLVTEE